MKKTTVTDRSVLLTPTTEDDLGIGLGLDDAGQLRAAITITTDTWGDFIIPLTAAQVGLLAVTARKFLDLTEDQAEGIRQHLHAERQKLAEKGEPTDD